MEKRLPMTLFVVGLVMLSVGIALALAHVGVGDIHEGTVVGKGVAPPYWDTTRDTFLLIDIDGGGSIPLVMPVDTDTFARYGIGDEITWENRSVINTYLALLAGAGFFLALIAGVAAAWNMDW